MPQVPTNAQASKQNPETINHQISTLIKKKAFDMWQALPPQSINNPSLNNLVFQFQPLQTGLTKKFRVQTTITITGATTHASTLTENGISNVFSNVILTDMYSNQRINTTGLHLMTVASFKQKFPFLSAMEASSNDNSSGYGANIETVNTAPTSIVATTTGQTVYHTLDVPLAYSDISLRGALYTNLTINSMTLQLTVNPNFFVTNAADHTQAVYYNGTSAGTDLPTITNITINVYQNYFDQLPKDKNGADLLPPIDIGTAYQLITAPVATPIANQDNIYPYASERTFLSTMAFFDNGGTVNALSDLNAVSLRVASSVNIFRAPPSLLASWNRVMTGFDFPKGVMFLSHRDRPINLKTWGNVALLYNPATVGAGSVFTIGYESMQPINLILSSGTVGAGSL